MHSNTAPGSVPSNRIRNYCISTQPDQKNAPGPVMQELKTESPNSKNRAFSALATMGIIFSLKIIKIVLCVAALTLILTFKDDYRINIKCPDENDIEVNTKIVFPFRLHDLSHITPVCNKSEELIYFENNFSVESGVFVGMAVVTIVYVILTLLVHSKKHSKPVYLVVDILYHGILAALWLNSSFVWAVGLEHFMGELEFDNIKFINRHICQDNGELCSLNKNVDFLLLDLSVLLGFVIALVSALIVSLICTQVVCPSQEDESKWTHDQQDLYKNKKSVRTSNLKLIEEGDEYDNNSTTSSDKDSIRGGNSTDITGTSSERESLSGYSC